MLIFNIADSRRKNQMLAGLPRIYSALNFFVNKKLIVAVILNHWISPRFQITYYVPLCKNLVSQFGDNKNLIFF
jgi:hypothetical protein